MHQVFLASAKAECLPHRSAPYRDPISSAQRPPARLLHVAAKALRCPALLPAVRPAFTQCSPPSLACGTTMRPWKPAARSAIRLKSDLTDIRESDVAIGRCSPYRLIPRTTSCGIREVRPQTSTARYRASKKGPILESIPQRPICSIRDREARNIAARCADLTRLIAGSLRSTFRS